MFGDIAHGSILLAFGLYLIFWHKKIANPILKMLLPHRYILALMGFFATYCGFIYNDYLSISLDLFGSCYSI
jgi:V-type H+-transporting ATPase subunit a